MTIEEKAKAYDELLLKLQKAKVDDNVCDEMYYRVIDDIVPELKESEDERIREELIGFLRNIPNSNYTCEEMALWLEKQGESNPYSGVSFKYNGHIWGMCARDNGVEILVDGEIKERVFLGSKPQGNSALEAINEEKVDNANKVEPKDYSSIDPHFGKPVDKVKPKFKQGQWIVWKNKCYKVNYNGCGYELIDQNGLSTSLEYGTVDTSARLWDVTKDAKAGDVLVIQETDFTYESIFIFNKIENNHIIQYLHYFITDTDEEVCKVKSVGGFLGDVGDNVHPATKEQRDTLMKAMTDAGYTFDFDKKELKKIEYEIEIPFGAKDSELIEESYYIPKGFHAEIDGDKVVIKKGEKPIEWSEEDEKMLQGIWDEIIANKHDAKEYEWKTYDKFLDWLKSLKGRVQPQPKQEWSEEDENLLKLSFENLTELKDRYGAEYGKVGDCISWLKSLKQRYTWKPTEKQINAIRLARSFVTDDFGKNPTLSDTLVELVKQLNKLK